MFNVAVLLKEFQGFHLLVRVPDECLSDNVATRCPQDISTNELLLSYCMFFYFYSTAYKGYSFIERLVVIKLFIYLLQQVYIHTTIFKIGYKKTLFTDYKIAEWESDD